MQARTGLVFSPYGSVFTTRFQFQFIAHLHALLGLKTLSIIDVLRIDTELADRRFMLPRQGTMRR
jgi:hypothetical protein